MIGVLATEGTVSSNSYQMEIQKFYPDFTVVQHACPLWVPLIENNTHNTPAGRAFIKEDVEKLLEMNKDIDTIVLGCTHYPVLKEYIESIIPENITVVAQGSIVAESLKEYLDRHPEIEQKCTKNGSLHFLTTEVPDVFDPSASRLLGEVVKSEQIRFE